jgi:hypothetical protein
MKIPSACPSYSSFGLHLTARSPDSSAEHLRQRWQININHALVLFSSSAHTKYA